MPDPVTGSTLLTAARRAHIRAQPHGWFGLLTRDGADSVGGARENRWRGVCRERNGAGEPVR